MIGCLEYRHLNQQGHQDVLEVRLPGVMRQQLEKDEVKLLQYFDDEAEKLSK